MKALFFKYVFLCAELLKRTDTQTHVRAKFFLICAKFSILNAELAKQVLFYIFGKIWKVFFEFYMFLTAISAQISAQDFIKLNSDCSKKSRLCSTAVHSVVLLWFWLLQVRNQKLWLICTVFIFKLTVYFTAEPCCLISLKLFSEELS